MLTAGQFNGGAGSGGSAVCTVPPGPGQLVLSNLGTGTVYVGIGGTAVTATNGMPIAAGAVVPITLFSGGAGGTLRCVTSAGTTVLGWIVSASYGLNQPGVQ